MILQAAGNQGAFIGKLKLASQVVHPGRSIDHPQDYGGCVSDDNSEKCSYCGLVLGCEVLKSANSSPKDRRGFVRVVIGKNLSISIQMGAK